jgi:nitroimidazol reductase NimA-like FMN-containing flavoprotein (pyridoxamine 5'-phosphate oxidase superfamily)
MSTETPLSAPDPSATGLSSADRPSTDRPSTDPSSTDPSSTDLSSTGRTALHRHKERGRTERTDLYAVLDAGLICHLGVTIDGVPVVLPTAYGRDGDRLYLHGSSANRSILAADGQEVCVTVTHLDGIVCARAVFSHSMNYRCAVVFGTARQVHDEDEQMSALRIITEQLVPGRWAAARPPSRKELAATAVLEVPLTEASVKVRTGPPGDDPADYGLDVWAGVLPAILTLGEQLTDPTLAPGIAVPEHIRALAGRPHGADLAGDLGEGTSPRL